MIVPGASHTDLYDRTDIIPFEKIYNFFNRYLRSSTLSADKTIDTIPDAGRRMCAKQPMQIDGIVRLSKVEVYPEYLDRYLEYAAEVGEVSLQTEPGVLTMYAVSEKEHPCMITILETYASREAYRTHIASTHFQKYKKGTRHMVKSLILADQTPLNPANRIENYIKD